MREPTTREEALQVAQRCARKLAIVDGASAGSANRLGITSSLTFETATLKNYATGFVQTNIAGFTELICDIEGEMVTPGYLGLAVVNDDAILTTPVGASWNFYGELTDVDGWIQRFSRYPLLPPEDRPKLNF